MDDFHPRDVPGLRLHALSVPGGWEVVRYPAHQPCPRRAPVREVERFTVAHMPRWLARFICFAYMHAPPAAGDAGNQVRCARCGKMWDRAREDEARADMQAW